jgi:hypothetical protein
MRKLFLLSLILLFACQSKQHNVREKISLAGEWKFRIDREDRGIADKWFNDLFDETVTLPGSMAENGKGEDVTINTDWTGDIIDRSYFTDKKYEKYRQPGNLKIPFWLKPVKYYKGVAWYQKEIDLPSTGKNKRIILNLERCHWQSSVYINGKAAGTQNSLSTPHEYDLTSFLNPGRNMLSIRIDNRVIIPVGVNSHSISDHTQSDWNGITGDISLNVVPGVYLDEIQVIPDISKGIAKVNVHICNPGGTSFKGKLRFKAEKILKDRLESAGSEIVIFVTNSSEQDETAGLKIRKPELWSEFNPALYRMTVSLTDKDGRVTDCRSVDFGMREFGTNGTHFEVNGRPVFLRGTTECCIFPLTGYPPADTAAWGKVLRTVREYGLNHVRFHSYCPPEAAFEVADRLGIYFHIECASWANQGSTIGDSSSLDRFIYDESDRIIKAFGNHPSFCMLAYGNEPAGRNQKKYLGQLIGYWRSKDNRRIYTSGAGWPIIPENDYNVTSEPRIQHWGEGLKSIINSQAPQTMFDFRDFVSNFKVPTVGHEIGQWCVYPDFKEIEKYTGVLKPSNFEIFRETLTENNMADQAEDFLQASGKLQVLCYKADIEAALRTPGFGGFEMLQLHDFPGQGTALVGILNPFFESKGYVKPEEFRRFCNETVPLARMEKMIFRNGETFKAMIEITHYGEKPLKNANIVCSITDPQGKLICCETMHVDEIKYGNNIAGAFIRDIKGIPVAEKLKFEISITGTEFSNQWDLWVYPETIECKQGAVYITDRLDKNAEEKLKSGGSVLLLTYGKVGSSKGAGVAIGFSSIFWNTAWTSNQPPHTLGIICDPSNPFFRDFPTENHSNWQWWDPVSHSQAMILNDFPAQLKPIIQPVDTWFENRKLALAFEARAGGGKLLVCSIDLMNLKDERIVSRQLLKSILDYMNGSSFNPQTELQLNKVKEIIN